MAKKKLKIRKGRAFGTIFDISASRRSSNLGEDFNLYEIINDKGSGNVFVLDISESAQYFYT